GEGGGWAGGKGDGCPPLMVLLKSSAVRALRKSQRSECCRERKKTGAAYRHGECDCVGLTLHARFGSIKFRSFLVNPCFDPINVGFNVRDLIFAFVDPTRTALAKTVVPSILQVIL